MLPSLRAIANQSPITKDNDIVLRKLNISVPDLGSSA